MANKDEKIKFIEGAMESLKKELLKNIDRIPDNWNGAELRWYIAEKADEFVWSDMKDKRSARYKSYRNDVITENL